TEEMIGAWPFHDHCRNIGMNVNRGLFGGIVVLPREDCDRLPRFPLPKGLEELLEKGMLSGPSAEYTRDQGCQPVAPMHMAQRTVAMPMTRGVTGTPLAGAMPAMTGMPM